MAGLFGRLFGGGEGSGEIPAPLPRPVGGDPTTQEFAALAIELIDEFIATPNVVWESISENSVADENNPFEVGKPVSTDYAVKILFVRDDLEDRQLLRYLRETTLVSGQVNGWMYPYSGLTPKLKDVVRWEGQNLTVKAIDPIQPIDSPVIYFIEFGS